MSISFVPFSTLFSFLVFALIGQASETHFELSPLQIWSEEYQQAFQQIQPVNRINNKKIQNNGLTDLNRVIQTQTGVQIQHEDAWGLRPNIGIRGTPPHRSRKVSFYEDGVLIGPAPYSAPAAYYTPHIGRVDRIEIYKGLQALLYGPNTVGGALEYLTRPIGPRRHRELQLQYGQFNTQRYNLFLSESPSDSPHGWALALDNMSSDGFKVLDGGGPTGFNKSDALLKYQYQMPEWPVQLRLKLGHAHELSHETYLGLSIEDFNASPYRRYKSSNQDFMVFTHNQINLGLLALLADQWQWDTQIYHHRFNRNWQRLNNFHNSNVAFQEVLQNPQGTTNQTLLQLLRGEINSDEAGGILLDRANNDRYFFSQGLQTQLESPTFNLGDHWKLQGKLQARWHQDQIERRHTIDRFAMKDHQMELQQSHLPATQNQDTTWAQSLATQLQLQNQKWIFQFSQRSEWLEYQMVDFANPSNQKAQAPSLHLPGFGFLYQASEHWALLGSTSQAATIAGPQALTGTDNEKALNTEIGTRFFSPEMAAFSELVAFQTQYENIQGLCSFSTGCLSDLDQVFKGGQALVRGLEFKVHKSFQLQGDWVLPIEWNATWMQAHFTEGFTSTNPEWGRGSIQAGDPFPYIPNLTHSWHIGLENKKFQHQLLFHYTSSQWDQSQANNRFSLPAYSIIDWNTQWQLTAEDRLIFRIDNLLNTPYLVSLRPFGARPGKPQSFMLGYQRSF